MMKKFSNGQEVEVTSSEPGFEESWYVANVVRRSKKKKYLVEYRNLVQEADSTKKLKESVEFSQLRPLPPPSLNSESFQLSQIVDAFLNDGWWKGVITKVLLPSLRYAVFFKPTNEEKEFNHSDLRIHLDWIRGNWVTPPSPHQEAVVIAQDEANVQSPKLTGNSALRKGMSTPQTPTELRDVGWESALSSSIMKCGRTDDQSPPNGTISSSYALLSSQEKMKQSDPKNNAEIARPSMEVREGEAAETPTCIEVCNGKVASKESPADGHATNNPTIGGDVMALGNSDVIAFPIPFEQWRKRQNIGLSTEEMKELLSDAEIKHQLIGSGDDQSEKVLKRKRGRPFGSGRNSKRGRKRALKMTFQSKGLVNESTSKKPTDVNTSYILLSNRIVEEHQPLSMLPKKFDSQMEIEVRGSENESASKKKTNVQTGFTPFSSCVAEEPEPPFILPTKSSSHIEKEVGGPKNESSIKEMTDVHTTRTPLSSHIAEDHRPLSTFRKKSRSRMVKDIGGLVDKQIVDVLKRKRGRPKGSNKKSSERVPEKECSGKGITGVAGKEIAGVQMEWTSPSSNLAEVQHPFPPSGEKFSCHMVKCNGGPEHEAASKGIVAQTELTQLLSHAAEKDQSNSPGCKMSISLVEKENGVDLESLNVVGSLFSKAHPTPNGLHQYDSASGDGRALHSADITADTFSSLLQQDEGTQVQQADGGPPAVQDGSLPFIKCSHIWGLFESMEVFRSMPQEPHFRPLEKYNEDLREGYAIGNMLNFSNLADKTWKAKFDEPMSMFESKLKALADLEELGFSVNPIRCRINKLLKIKESYAQFDERWKAAEKEVVEEKRQLDVIDESIVQLNTKLETLVMEREMKGSYIAELQRKIDATKERIHGVKIVFDNIVGSPLRTGSGE